MTSSSLPSASTCRFPSSRCSLLSTTSLRAENFRDMILLLLSLVSLFATLLVVPLATRAADRLGLVDHPAHRKMHPRAVPYLGGLAITLGSALPVSWLVFSYRDCSATLLKLGLLLGLASAAGLLGLLDDWKPLRGRHKLLGQVLVVIPFVVFGFRFEVLDIPTQEPISLGLWSIPLTVFWMVSVSNAVNLIDGIDGLASSVTAAVLASAAACAYILQDHLSALLSVIVLGALVGFLRYNWSPARIYLGDAGSLGLGMFTAGLFIALAQEPRIFDGAAPPQTAFLFEYRIQLVSLALLYPLMEIGLSVSRRTAQGKAIGSADTDHIHHCLQREGWTPPQICAVASLISALAGGASVAAVRELDALAAILIMLASLSAGVVIHVCGYPELFFLSRIREARSAYLMCRNFTSMQLLKLASTRSVGEILALLDQTCEELGLECLEMKLWTSEGRPVRHQWKRKPASGSGRIRWESARLPGVNYVAEWCFLPDSPAQHDLQVEYRVRMHEIVSRALHEIHTTSPGEKRRYCETDEGATAPSSVRCHELAARSSGNSNRAEQERSTRSLPPVPTAPRTLD